MEFKDVIIGMIPKMSAKEIIEIQHAINNEVSGKKIEYVDPIGAHSEIIQSVLKDVSEAFGASIEGMKKRDRSHHVLFPRQFSCFLLRHVTSLTQKQISTVFLMDNHTTVGNSVNAVKQMYFSNFDYRETIAPLMEKYKLTEGHFKIRG